MISRPKIAFTATQAMCC